MIAPLYFPRNHLLIELEERIWVLDTGSPLSFGIVPLLALTDTPFPTWDGMTEQQVTELCYAVDATCSGVIGNDTLKDFDMIIDPHTSTATISREQLSMPGIGVPLVTRLGTPAINVRIGESEKLMNLATGPGFSYCDRAELEGAAPCDPVVDYLPGPGSFETQTHQLTVGLGSLSFSVRAAPVPVSLRTTMGRTGSSGVIGNAIAFGRRLGYFPRRGLMVLGPKGGG